jgi:hypothetical protein
VTALATTTLSRASRATSPSSFSEATMPTLGPYKSSGDL